MNQTSEISLKTDEKRTKSAGYQLIKSNCTIPFNIVILFLLFPALFAGCYSFHGGSPPEGVKTIAVPVMNDESGFANAAIRDQTTTQLITKFTRDHTLQVVDKASADAVLDATIKSITNKMVAIGADDRSSRQHIDVTVQVTLENLRKHKTIWEKPFTSSAEYDPNGDVTQRDAAVLQALDHITDDIVLETVSQW